MKTSPDSFKSRLKKVVETRDTLGGKIFDTTIQVLIVFAVVAFSVSTIPEISEELKSFLRWSQAVTIIVFSIEYGLRIYVADSKRWYIFSFYGIIDLLAILPFYLALAIDLRALRILRLLRIFELLKMARYSSAVEKYRRAFLDIKAELVVFIFATCFLIYVAAVGVYYFEHEVQPEAFKSIFHSLWWALATVTTVGYGDVYPITAGGRIFTFFILMIGVGILAVPAGLLASALYNIGKKNPD